jgi:hypothetical protein
MTYRSQYTQRYNFGKKSEADVLPTIREYFKRDIEQTKEKYNEFDFKDSVYNYELKTRTNLMKAYPTTMTTLNKCKANSILLFKYIDCLAYIEYDEDKFKNYNVIKYTRYEDKHKRDHIFIPVEDLIIIC